MTHKPGTGLNEAEGEELLRATLHGAWQRCVYIAESAQADGHSAQVGVRQGKDKLAGVEFYSFEVFPSHR